ncbi:aquaporin-10-like [Babylonia areolata]|uniref:aquaporin-10-like n=1 Tax=Babylonia areolata TaxID=304850 RepID=UPI003FD4246B
MCRTTSNRLSLANCPLAREFLAEFLGTFLLVTFGDGSVAQAVLGGPTAGGAITIAWSFGVGITLGVMVSGNISGGHINPAVSLAMVFLRKLPLRKLPVYALAQYLGAFLASLFIWLVYMDALEHYDGGKRMVEGVNATAGIWSTYPQPYVSTWTGLGDQVFATALLMVGVLAVTDQRGLAPSRGLVPFLVGLVVFGIAMTFGLNCAFAINPARDLAPRIFTVIAGWGTKPFSFRGYNWFWVPLAGPHVGALLGALVYQLCVGLHWPEEEEDGTSYQLPHTQGIHH